MTLRTQELHFEKPKSDDPGSTRRATAIEGSDTCRLDVERLHWKANAMRAERLKAELREARRGRRCVLVVGEEVALTHLDGAAEAGFALDARAEERRKAVRSTCGYLSLVARVPVIGISRGDVAATRRRGERESSRWCESDVLEYRMQEISFPTERPAITATSAGLARGGDCLWLAEPGLLGLARSREALVGIRNPIGIRVGPATRESLLIDACTFLNPRREGGKIMLATSFGRDSNGLRRIIAAVHRARLPVVWLCQPGKGPRDHVSGAKDDFATDEITETLRAHADQGSRLCGLSLGRSSEESTRNVQDDCGMGCPKDRFAASPTLGNYLTTLRVCSHFARAYSEAP